MKSGFGEWEFGSDGVKKMCPIHQRFMTRDQTLPNTMQWPGECQLNDFSTGFAKRLPKGCQHLWGEDCELKHRLFKGPLLAPPRPLVVNEFANFNRKGLFQ